MNERVTLKSGIVLELQMASFSLSMRLLKTIVNEVKTVDLGGFKFGAEVKVEELLKADLPVDALKNVVCQLLGSDAVELAVRDCAKVCLYDKQAIRQDTFEEENARQDYLPVAWEVIRFNLTPFFRGLGLKSSGDGKPSTSAPP
jgi:hypothetical protein